MDHLVDTWQHYRPGGRILVADTHTAGNPTRIILGGVTPPAPIRTVQETRAWLRDEADWVRRRLIHEPRGGALTCAVLPLPAHDPDHDIGAVILEPGSYPPMCGHCMIGLSSAIDELGLIPDIKRVGNAALFTIRTPAGLVRSEVVRQSSGPTLVTLTNVDSYVVDSWMQEIGGRLAHLDLLWGGDYYPTIDATELGLPLDREHAGDIIRLARDLSRQLSLREIRDPVTDELLDVYQVMFHERIDGTSPRSRVVVVAPPGAIDRSPCGTGSSALLALRIARGEMTDREALVTMSIVGSSFTATAGAVGMSRGRQVVSPRVTGSAHVNGFSVVVADPTDEFRDGFPPL